jgi:hypothetical protein
MKVAGQTTVFVRPITVKDFESMSCYLNSSDLFSSHSKGLFNIINIITSVQRVRFFRPPSPLPESVLSTFIDIFPTLVHEIRQINLLHYESYTGLLYNTILKASTWSE